MRLSIAEPDHNQIPQGRRGGRKYPLALIIATIRETRGMIALAARKLGCERKTIYHAAKRHPSVQQAIDEEREVILDETELRLVEAVQAGEPWAVQFFLKTQGRARGYADGTTLGFQGQAARATLERAFFAHGCGYRCS